MVALVTKDSVPVAQGVQQDMLCQQPGAMEEGMEFIPVAALTVVRCKQAVLPPAATAVSTRLQTPVAGLLGVRTQ